jgi:hypothetical protein
MNSTQIYALVIAATICLLATAGCSDISGTGQPEYRSMQHPFSMRLSTVLRWDTVSSDPVNHS